MYSIVQLALRVGALFKKFTFFFKHTPYIEIMRDFSIDHEDLEKPPFKKVITVRQKDKDQTLPHKSIQAVVSALISHTVLVVQAWLKVSQLPSCRKHGHEHHILYYLSDMTQLFVFFF